MAKAKIFVVDGESGILELVRYHLPKNAYQVKGVLTRDKMLAEVTDNCPDLILLDLTRPGLGGLRVCRELKKNPKTEQIPIILLTAGERDSDIVTGLDLGADAYLSRPFSPRVLVALVRAVLRKKCRHTDFEGGVVTVGGLMIDPFTHKAMLNGATLTLTSTEFALLRLLALKPGRVFSRYQIIRSVKGQNYSATGRSVDTQIMELRRKLGEALSLIETVRGVGYRFRT